ncbi:MAG: hypothetical protein M2R45_02989 [Verrucomicrobia subdivision 3 bacterium]|nr:hypothetical protein [Limisphaerales bacterium]MCS1416525.1 hypothetical protein [Limisphaerales bacterium]
MILESGGTVTSDSDRLLEDIKYAPLQIEREVHLATSFSDLRYYLSCPHDFYLRKVLGFAPTIDQGFGYGRGVYNLMRAIHSDPSKWANLAEDRSSLVTEIHDLVKEGLFYLRYTTGDTADNMQKKGVKLVADCVSDFAKELAMLTFEPEEEFETLLKYEDGEEAVLISGAMDVVRLIDFTSLKVGIQTFI